MAVLCRKIDTLKAKECVFVIDWVSTLMEKGRHFKVAGAYTALCKSEDESSVPH
jgi:hypothetical protein